MRTMEFIDRHPIPSVSSDEYHLLDVATRRSSSYTDAAPAHYTLKINSFSKLSDIIKKSGVDKYESGEFEAGDHKWKLLLYPNGDAKKNGDGHISLYLALADTNATSIGSHFVDAIVRFFVYDHVRNKYLVIQDGETKRYHVLKTQHGFHKLLPLSTFNDSKNGYLVDDCCAFGAEVYVVKNTGGHGQEFSLINDPYGCVYWKIDNFSTLEDKHYYSQVYNIGGYKWKLSLNPKGDYEEKGRSLSLYIRLDGNASDFNCQGVYAEADLLLKDQVGGIHRERKVTRLFRNSPDDTWGYPNFMLLSDLRDESKGFIVNDTLVLEAKLTLVSSIKQFS